MQHRWSEHKPLQCIVSAKVEEEKAFEIGRSDLDSNLIRQVGQIE